jgi:threonylcarbamoyladenosine tRNA methylthiotransferase MtaB
MTKSFKIVTLGCKVNQYESAFLEEALTNAGWHRGAKEENADVAVVNTCIVTQTAAHQSRQAIRKAVRENPNGTVAAVGCYAQVFPEELNGIQGIGLIAGNTVKRQLPELLLNAGESREKNIVLKEFEPGMPFEFLPIRRFSDRTRAFLKVQDGCQSFCSYCIVPLARGPYRSLSPEKVLSIVESLTREGYKEIVLTGIHLGKYGVDLDGKMNLNHLLAAIGKKDFPIRIRLSSLEINEIDAELIEMVASESWLCRHFHIPLQSGDDEILRKMRRNYTGRQFVRLIKTICDSVPLAAVGVDIMSGFPGENPVAQQNTYSLIKDLPVSYLHVFPFSPRSGTAASTFDGQVDPKAIKERAARLRDLGQKKRIAFYRSCLKKDFMVLSEGWHSEEKKMMKGLSDNYLPVLFPSLQDTNQFVSVRMERVVKDMVVGSLNIRR